MLGDNKSMFDKDILKATPGLPPGRFAMRSKGYMLCTLMGDAHRTLRTMIPGFPRRRFESSFEHSLRLLKSRDSYQGKIGRESWWRPANHQGKPLAPCWPSETTASHQ